MPSIVSIRPFFVYFAEQTFTGVTEQEMCAAILQRSAAIGCMCWDAIDGNALFGRLAWRLSVKGQRRGLQNESSSQPLFELRLFAKCCNSRTMRSSCQRDWCRPSTLQSAIELASEA